VQRGQLEAVGVGLQACRARCGRLRDGRGVRWAGIKGDGVERGTLPCILPSSAGILDSCVFFALNSTRYYTSDQDDEMSHLTSKNCQKHEEDELQWKLGNGFELLLYGGGIPGTKSPL